MADIRGNNGDVKYRTSEGLFGSTDIRNQFGEIVYNKRGDYVYDSSGQRQYEIRGDMIYNTHGERIGEIRGGQIFNQYGERQGFMP